MGKSPKIGKITSINKGSADPLTLSGSLAKMNHSRFPGAVVVLPPHRERTNEFRTGLDPNAKYIRDLEKISPVAAKAERERVTAEYNRIMEMTGGSIDLSPRSPFYENMNKIHDMNTLVCPPVRLKDGVNIFNLDDPEEAIVFAFARVLPEVAPSYAAYKEGRCSSAVLFYVDDEDYEAEVIHGENQKRAEAIATLVACPPAKQRKLAKLLGLKATMDTTDASIYNQLFAYLNDTSARVNHINLFNQVANLVETDLNVRYLVEEALAHNIYRVSGQRILEGQNEIAKSKEELIAYLKDPENSEEYLLLEDKLKQKQIIVTA